MITVIQRVSNAHVIVNEETIGEIQKGLLVLVGVFDDDTEKDIDYSVKKVSNIRIFADNKYNMNLSVKDIGGEVLVVSQFTLCGDTKKGRRPSFIHAAHPEKGELYYIQFIAGLRNEGLKVESGQFGALMDVHLNNSGPVTLVIDSKQK